MNLFLSSHLIHFLAFADFHLFHGAVLTTDHDIQIYIMHRLKELKILLSGIAL